MSLKKAIKKIWKNTPQGVFHKYLRKGMRSVKRSTHLDAKSWKTKLGLRFPDANYSSGAVTSSRRLSEMM